MQTKNALVTGTLRVLGKLYAEQAELGNISLDNINSSSIITTSLTVSDEIQGTAKYANNLNGFKNTTTSATAIDSAISNGLYYVNGTSGIYNISDGACFVQAYSSSLVAQIYQDYRTGQIALRGKNNGTWQSFRKVLDSSNYTSYTVNKTGSGASGTWGISITGNAATATKLATARTISLTGSVTGSATFDGSGNVSITTATNHTHSEYLSTGGTAASAYSLSNRFTSRQASLNFNLANATYLNKVTYTLATSSTTTGKPPSDSCVLTLSWDNNGWGSQLAISNNNSPHLYIRGACNSNGASSWDASWTTVLDSGNYTNYTVKTDGSGAKGTWAISVTGNAATATKLATARNITLAGAITGTVSFDGSGNANITTSEGNVSFKQSSTQIDATTDWNTITTAGCYKVQMNSGWGDAATYHGPNNFSSSLYSYGLLLVFKSAVASENRTVQIYLPHRANDSIGKIVTRMLNGTGWNDWAVIYKGLSASDVSALPLSGGTMTGNISFNMNGSTQTPVKIYGGSSNGQGLLIGAGGATVVGSGESARHCDDLIAATTEELWLTSDTIIRLYTNCNTIDNKVGIVLDKTLNLYPETDSTGSIGKSGAAWNTAYINTVTGSLAGNASTATKLQTTRTINGTSFDGTGNITTANWGTARTLTVGNKAISVNGSGNVTWSLTDIGAAAAKPNVSGNMNGAAAYGNAIGMINLSGTDTNINPNGQTGWHHFINLSYNTETSNMWQTQIANAAGSTDLWVRSRRGGAVSNDTAWVAPWTRILTGSNFTNVVTPAAIGAATSGHGHTTLSGVQRISFNSDSSDACSISSTVSGGTTYMDFNLSDDLNTEKWRWMFNAWDSANTTTVLYSAMELRPRTTSEADLYVSGNLYGKGSLVYTASNIPNYAGSSSKGGNANKAVALVDKGNSANTLYVSYDSTALTTTSYFAGYSVSGTTVYLKRIAASTAKTVLGVDKCLLKAGDSMTGALGFANNTWNPVGDDVYIGDCNKAGLLGIKGANGASGIIFKPYSGSTDQTMKTDGNGTLSVTGTLSPENLIVTQGGFKIMANGNSESNGGMFMYRKDGSLALYMTLGVGGKGFHIHCYDTSSKWINAVSYSPSGGDLQSPSRVSAPTIAMTRLLSSSPDSFNVGPSDYNNRIEATDSFRLYTSKINTNDTGVRIYGATGEVDFMVNSVSKHHFSANGTKTGGTMEIEGTVYGMSPIDSPQTLIEYVDFDVEVNGDNQEIKLDFIFRKMVTKYAVIISNPNIKLISKEYDKIIVSGTGTTDIVFKGQRRGAEEYFRIMGGFINGTGESNSL